MARPFRLQTVATLRESRREEARARLAEAVRAADVLREKQTELAERYRVLLEQRREATTIADANWQLGAGRYALVLKGEERALKENIAAVEKEIENRQLVLAEADREVRAIEKLRERAEREQRLEKLKREARVLDEFASRQAFDASASTSL